MSERSPANHCPYCGDEDLRPHTAEAGSWECHSCLRAFRLHFLGLVRPSGPGPDFRSENP
jgi:transposase-like protein